MAGLTILETAAASVPTPAANKNTIYFESADGLPYYKTDAGAVVQFVAGGPFAPVASPTFTGTVALPTAWSINGTTITPTGTELNYVDGVTSAIQTQLDGKSNGSIPQNSQSADYTAVLGDANKHIFHPGSDTTPRTFTIPANSSVAYPIGTTLTFVNDALAGTITIAITSDTMRFAGVGGTGSRTLAAIGMATALKIGSTLWIINGVGLT